MQATGSQELEFISKAAFRFSSGRLFNDFVVLAANSFKK